VLPCTLRSRERHHARSTEEELFRSIFETLTIVGEPAPFAADEPAWDGPGIGAEPFEAIVDSSDATVYEPEEPGK
jgi:hypothetical protein